MLALNIPIGGEATLSRRIQGKTSGGRSVRRREPKSCRSRRSACKSKKIEVIEKKSMFLLKKVVFCNSYDF